MNWETADGSVPVRDVPDLPIMPDASSAEKLNPYHSSVYKGEERYDKWLPLPMRNLDQQYQK